jgi:hypothetical protein
VPQRLCSEWTEETAHEHEPLTRPSQKTCSTKCRNRRARRIKRQNRERVERMAAANSLPEHLKPLSDATNPRAVRDAAHELVKEELRPVVRESLTQDVLNGIGRLVNLTPKMVAAIEEDLDSSDKYLRQKAYSLLARYTLGNSSVAPAPAQHAPAPMQVVFQLPRPGDDLDKHDADYTLPAVVEELRTCQECQAEKPATEFVGDSERCLTCHGELQDRVTARYG